MIVIIGSLLNWWRHGLRVFTNIFFSSISANLLILQTYTLSGNTKQNKPIKISTKRKDLDYAIREGVIVQPVPGIGIIVYNGDTDVVMDITIRQYICT